MAAVKSIGEGYYSISAKNVTADEETHKRTAKVFQTIRSERPSTGTKTSAARQIDTSR